MDGLQVCQVIVLKVYTDAEVEASVTSVHNLEVTKLKKCVNECNTEMHTCK